MELYFSKRGEAYYKGDHNSDIYPNYSYQVGATPEGAEIAKEHKKVVSAYTDSNKSSTPQPPPNDGKWRYFWNIGESIG
jgi:hypothetical protein